MTLTVTIDLSPDEEKILQLSILRRDKVKVRQLLSNALEPTIAALMQITDSDLDNLTFDEISERLWAEVDARLPADFQPLSDFAMSREGIYDEHP